MPDARGRSRFGNPCPPMENSGRDFAAWLTPREDSTEVKLGRIWVSSGEHRRCAGATTRRGLVAGQEASEAGGSGSQGGAHRPGAAEGAGAGDRAGCRVSRGRLRMTSGMQARGRDRQLRFLRASSTQLRPVRASPCRSAATEVAASRYTNVLDHMHRAQKMLASTGASIHEAQHRRSATSVVRAVSGWAGR